MTSPSLPFVRDPRWVFDFLLAAVVTVLCVATAADSQGRDAQALSFLLTSSLLVRRSHPMLALGVATVAALGQAYYLTSPTLSIVVVPMIVYAVARYGKPSGGRAALWAGLAGAVIGPARWTGIGAAAAPAFAVTATACAAIVAGAYLLGRRLRERLEADEQQSRAASERRRLQESEQEQRARAAATDERSRIARELHDIVAHSLSVIVVQAEGGRAVVLKRPEVGARRCWTRSRRPDALRWRRCDASSTCCAAEPAVRPQLSPVPRRRGHRRAGGPLRTSERVRADHLRCGATGRHRPSGSPPTGSSRSR